MSMNRWLPDAAAWGLIAVLLLLALAPLLFSPGVLMRGDVALYFYPYWEAAARATREGRLPLWNPDLFAGVPFLANPQVGFFYPPNRLLSWMPAPQALKLSIGLHALWAAWGMYGLVRRRGARPGGALAAALAYAMGGYVLAQAEHINQFQALAWLPWMGWAWAARRPLTLGLAGAMQVLCGHAQTVFLSWTALALLFAPPWREARSGRAWVHAWGPGGLGGALALALSAAQWVPALELAGRSIRAGGLPLNEVLSFSLSPLWLGRSILPGREAPAFTEFTADVGVLGLLALAAGLGRGRWPVIAGVGLFFAWGAYNPLYVALAWLLPPLRAFRVPARWLALWAFGAALGIGEGFDGGLRGRLHPAGGECGRWGFVALIGLAAAAAPLRPAGMTGPLGPVEGGRLIGWIALVGIGLLLVGRRAPRALWLGLWAAELIGAAWGRPLNRLVPPEAWSFPRLPAYVIQDLVRMEGPGAGRILSVVDLRFDPGDLGEWRSRFEGRLRPEAFEEFLVALKQREALIPNLPMVWGLPTADGYDGGVLPLRRFIVLARRFVPADRLLRDGRLWESLPGIPEPRWLQVLGVRWIVTDRLRDEWVDGVFYDGGLTADACGPEPIAAGPFPSLEATELRLRITASFPPGVRLGEAALELADGEVLRLPVAAGEAGRPSIVRWEVPRRVVSVVLRSDPEACARGGWRVTGGALVDGRTGAFQALVLSPGGAFALRYAGDVKVYEFRRALPRLYGVCAADFVQGEEAAMARLTDPAFDPARRVVIEGGGEGGMGQQEGPCPVEIRWIRFTPEAREAEVRLERAGWLVLLESYDPGWRAWVDGRAVPVYPANGLFQAIAVPAGVHQVRWVYFPSSLIVGGIGTLLGVGGLAMASRRRGSPRDLSNGSP